MDPNRNDSPNNPRKPGDGQKPRSNIWLALIIAVIALLAISGIYNAVSASQYTQTTWSDFREAYESGNISEAEIQSDRIIYLTKDEAAKPAAQQKACFTGLPSGADTMAMANEMVDRGIKVDRLIVEDNSTLMMILYYLFMGLLIFGLMSMVTRRMSGDSMMGGFGKSKAKVYMEKSTGVTFKDVAGQGIPAGDYRFSAQPPEIHRNRRQAAQGRAAGRFSRYGQDAAGQGCGRRGQCSLLLHVRLRLCGDVCGNGR